MKSRCFLFAALLLTAVSVRAQDATPAVDPLDFVCIAYKLTPAEEASFNAVDGKVSDFWAQWDIRVRVGLSVSMGSSSCSMTGARVVLRPDLLRDSCASASERPSRDSKARGNRPSYLRAICLAMSLS